MKKSNPELLTPKLQAELAILAAMPGSEIDTTDMPLITDWNSAVRGPSAPVMVLSLPKDLAPKSEERISRPLPALP